MPIELPFKKYCTHNATENERRVLITELQKLRSHSIKAFSAEKQLRQDIMILIQDFFIP